MADPTARSGSSCRGMGGTEKPKALQLSTCRAGVWEMKLASAGPFSAYMLPPDSFVIVCALLRSANWPHSDPPLLAVFLQLAVKGNCFTRAEEKTMHALLLAMI